MTNSNAAANGVSNEKERKATTTLTSSPSVEVSAVATTTSTTATSIATATSTSTSTKKRMRKEQNKLLEHVSRQRLAYCQKQISVDDFTDKELHIAPMLDYSKREFRKLFSILSTRLVVWTDMIVDETIAHSERLDDILEPDRNLHNKQICQIGGNSPELCGKATQVVELIYGYDEINLNIGQ
mmetsp:Transcript_46284/g.46980  ORF Transcript_46284/g.46980 Transcript_46284/m.46980 type:complete len:183 (-) Transcript_46284:2751-3299(-)